jgi:anti-sigma B factor antagonist
MPLGNGEYKALRWASEESDSGVTLRLRGELDLPAVLACKGELIEELQRVSTAVVIELDELTFIDSTGLRMLLDLKSKLGEVGTSLTVGAISAPVARVFELAGVDGWFKTNAHTSRIRQAT